MMQLYDLAQQVEVGDEIKWGASKSKQQWETRKARTVTGITVEGERIHIEAKGPGEEPALSSFWVEVDGTSEATYNESRSMGPVERASLPNKGFEYRR
jgi:hypothetical protein